MNIFLKRMIAFLLCAVLLFGQVAMGVDASWGIEEHVETAVHINPLYADHITEDDLRPVDMVAPVTTDDVVYHTTIAEAGAEMREAMKARKGTIVVHYQTKNFDFMQHEDIFNAAVAHTGDPKAGDALLYNYAGYSVHIEPTISNGVYFVTFIYTMTYYTTAEQEAALDIAVDALLATVDPNGSDYEKLCAVYGWICTNIVYDYDTLYDDDYLLKYTAYAAMVNKTAVCQGYAVLLYRLALSLGLDCRIVVGIGNGGPHAWNIIKIDGKYYCVDVTWDATYYQALGFYHFFLRCEANFEDHYPEDNWEARGYYISKTDYVPEYDLDHSTLGHEIGEWVITLYPTCSEDGSKIRYCQQAGCDYFETDSVVATGLHTYDQQKIDPKYLASEGVYFKSCICGAKGTETFTITEEKPEVKPGEFVDVPANEYYHDPVMWAVENGITTGTGDGTTFEPNSVCTRGQVVTFLWRAAGKPEPTRTENPFVDVKSSDYFYKAVLWAVEKGITNGTGDGTTFEPNSNCNRAQIVTFLSRAKNGQPTSGENPFVDVPAGSYYYNPVLWAVENKITTGTGDGTTFKPDEECTRGQVITFLYRAYK